MKNFSRKAEVKDRDTSRQVARQEKELRAEVLAVNQPISDPVEELELFQHWEELDKAAY